MKLFYIQILISIIFSYPQNAFNHPGIKEEKNEMNMTLIKEELKESKISEIFEERIFNLTYKMNEVIKNAVDFKEEISNKTEYEKEIINNMLEEIKILKKKYKRDIIFTYLIGALILFTFFILYYNDYIIIRRRNKDFAYHRPEQNQNSNQIDIE